MKILRVFILLLIASVLCVCVAESFLIKDEKTDVTEEGQPNNVDLKPIKDYSAFANSKPFVDLAVSAGSALLCTSDGMTVYEKNADVPLPMASITKVMTVICALETLSDLSAEVTVPDSAVGIEGSSVYLARGERVTFEMLIYSAMLESANDATTALAVLCSGSEDAFVDLMNQKAKQLSMTKTHFCNPHGLHENEHYTTARDYVKLMSYALENETFCKIIATKKITFQKLDGSMTRVLTNHNRLLNTYSGMLGGKTGYTKTSGRTLITAARRNGVTLICITLNAPNDWKDHTSLFDKGFESLKSVSFTAETVRAEIEVAGEYGTLGAVLNQNVAFSVRCDDVVSYELMLPHILLAPIKKGEQIGSVVFLKNGEVIAKAPLVAENTVQVPKTKENKGFFGQLREFLRISS